MRRDGIDVSRFEGGCTTLELHRAGFTQVPSGCGVYLIIRDSARQPRFVGASPAGWFKGLDPSYAGHIVRSAWVADAHIVYIGKAAGVRGLRQRIGQLIRFGYGKSVGHRGGRLLWHLQDASELRVYWATCAQVRADGWETALIRQFRQTHGVRPFANRAK
jgi:hypothetical protein